MEEIIRLCLVCGGIVPTTRNGNSKFCSSVCYDQNKAQQAKVSGKQMAMERVLLKNEEILAKLFSVYGSYYFSASLMIEKDFNWAIYTNEVGVDGLIVKKIITYGYILFTNQNVQLWKF